jgi:hypothetical protein
MTPVSNAFHVIPNLAEGHFSYALIQHIDGKLVLALNCFANHIFDISLEIGFA